MLFLMGHLYFDSICFNLGCSPGARGYTTQPRCVVGCAVQCGQCLCDGHTTKSSDNMVLRTHRCP